MPDQMTSAQLASYLRTSWPGAKDYPDDTSLVKKFLLDHPERAGQVVPDNTPNNEGPSFSPVAFGLRTIPAALTSVGGPIGMAGSAGGEGLAQLYEYLTQGTKPRVGQLAAATGIGAIPFGAEANIASAAAKGAAVGAAGSVVPSVIDKGQLPGLKEFAASTLGGAVLGGGAHALFGAKPPINVPGKLAEDVTTGAIVKKLQDAHLPVPTKPIEPTQTHLEFTGKRDLPVPNMTETRPPLASNARFGPNQPDVEDILQKGNQFLDQRRGVQSNDRTLALADRVKVGLTELAPGTALNAEQQVAHANAIASIMPQRQALAQKIASGAGDDADKAQFNLLTLHATTLVKNYRGGMAEAGRALQASQIASQMLKVGDASFIDKILQASNGGLTTEKVAQLVAGAGDDPLAQLKVLQQYSEHNTAFQKGKALFYNSILSGTKTPIRKALADGFNFTANTFLPLTAAPVDVMRHAFGGKEREVFAGEVGQNLTAAIAAFPKAFGDMLYVIKNGIKPSSIEEAIQGRFDVPMVEAPGGLITNLPSRVLSGVSEMFKSLGTAQETYAGAYAMARKAGLTQPAQIQKFVVDHLTDPALLTQAKTFGTRAALQEQPWDIVQSLIKWRNTPGTSPVDSVAKGALTFFIPFMKTSANILRQGAETSPMGFAMEAARSGGRVGAQAMGRATMGSLLFMPIAYLAATGQLSGHGPSDPAQRNTLYEQGWQPNSVKIGNKWVNFHLFQPLAPAMSAVANAWDSFRDSPNQDDQTAMTVALRAMGASAESVLDQSFLSGLNGLMSAINDPERSGARFMQQMTQSMVPASGLLREVTQATDPTIRKPTGPVEAAKSIIPGLASSVPARSTRFGQPATRNTGVMGAFVAPEVSTQHPEDPIEKLLKAAQVNLGVPRANLSVKGEKLNLTPQQQQIVEQAIGQAHKQMLQRYVASGTQPNEEKVRSLLEEATRAINQRAIAAIRRNQPFTVESISPFVGNRQAETDAAYQNYLKSHGGR